MTSKSLSMAFLAGAVLVSAAGPEASAHDGAQDWQPAGKNCFLISNSHHGGTKQGALEQAQAGLPKLIEEFRRDNHWSKAAMRVTAAKVTPNPSLRSEVPEEAFLKPDVKTKTSYSQCWTGVIWPIVCTSGAKICRK